MRARVLLLPALLAIAGLARAAPPTVRLSYTLGRGAEQCAPERVLRELVAHELGYSPFTDAGEHRITVAVRRANHALIARIELTDDQDKLRGARSLTADDCDDLMPAIGLTLALTIDALANAQLANLAHLAPFAALPLAAVDNELPPLRVPSPRRPRPRLFHTQLSIGIVGTAATQPVPSLGATVQVDVQWWHFSAGLELRGDPPAGASLGNGHLETSLLVATLVGCVHESVAAMCILAGFGGERDASSFAQPTWTLWTALGARIALELPLWRFLEARVHLDVEAPLDRKLYSVSAPYQIYVYATPPLAASLGLALVARLP